VSAPAQEHDGKHDEHDDDDRSDADKHGWFLSQMPRPRGTELPSRRPGRAPARRAERFLLAGWLIRDPGRHRPGQPESGVVWCGCVQRPAGFRRRGSPGSAGAIMMTAWFREKAICGASTAARPRGPVAGWSAPGGVFDLGPCLLHVALEPVGAALGAPAPAAGEPAGGFLEAAFDRFGLCASFLPMVTGGFRSWIALRGRALRAGRRGLAGRPAPLRARWRAGAGRAGARGTGAAGWAGRRLGGG
jgi:hypothetical protein